MCISILTGPFYTIVASVAQITLPFYIVYGIQIIKNRKIKEKKWADYY